MDGASGSFDAPDHEYPSHLQLRLTATDSQGAKATVSVDLQPKTATIGVASSPTGVPITVDSQTHPASWTATVIRGGVATVSAPLTRTIAGKRNRFSTWNDSHQRVRTLTVASDKSLKATYVPDAPDACTSATTVSPKKTSIGERSSGNGDGDWFLFHLAKKRPVTITLANLPVGLRLDLYRACGSAAIASSNQPGTQAERIARTLRAGYYRVRVKSPGDAWSGSPYTLRFQPG